MLRNNVRRDVAALLWIPLLGCSPGTPETSDAATGAVDASPLADTGVADSGSLRPDSGPVDSGVSSGCSYPGGAVEPMALGAVLWPYRWPQAINGEGRALPLDLANAPCANDEDIDWSPFDVLVFISIPAW